MPPIFSCVFCIRHFFWGKKIVKMSNDKFGSFFPVFLIKLTLFLWYEGKKLYKCQMKTLGGFFSCFSHKTYLFFYGMGVKKIVKMSNDRFGWFFSCFSHKTYLWSGRRDLGWRRSPFWILTHLFTRIFVQQREKLELFAIQYMTCHEQGTFFLFFALLMAEFIYKLLHIAKYFVKKSQWITQIFQYSVITDCGTIKY